MDKTETKWLIADFQYNKKTICNIYFQKINCNLTDISAKFGIQKTMFRQTDDLKLEFLSRTSAPTQQQITLH